jgi:phage tail-like protein
VRGQGELRRYLQIFGLALDQMRSLAEGLKARHDVLNVRADLLPYLARWIGWEPDLTADEITQRRDILFAPRVYRTVGTIPNVRALVNRVTGWDCRVKEFVHNVLLTNAPEAIRLWELWERRHDGSAWGDPVPVTRTDGFDGRPAAVVGGGAVWLFWHSDRSGRREIWMQRLGGVDPAPLKAAQGAPDDVPEAAHTDECPAAAADGAQVWLAWSSNRAEHWDIWVRSYDGLPGSAPAPLTEHPAEDRHPAIVRDGSGHMWVFWQSNRRGPVDIWARVYDGSEWGAPARVTTAGFRHETPAAVVDDSGRIWLFWSATLGERRNLWCQVYDAGWGTPVQITEGAQRDESPAAILRDGEIWLFWHSNRDGGWQIWGRVHDGAGWQAPFRVTTHVTADKEPAALLVPDGSPGSELRLTWRSQRRGTGYRSRTIDTGDAGVLARLGTFEDRSHYTYDTGRENDDWYARDAVGLYLTPDTEDHEAIEQQLERVQGFVEPFRPLPVRYVWILDWLVHEEIIDIRGLIREEYADEVL